MCVFISSELRSFLPFPLPVPSRPVPSLFLPPVGRSVGQLHFMSFPRFVPALSLPLLSIPLIHWFMPLELLIRSFAAFVSALDRSLVHCFITYHPTSSVLLLMQSLT